MRIVETLLLTLAATSVAQAQSLLGDSEASPYDPPRRPAFKKRDHLQIVFQEGSRARGEEWARFGSVGKPPADLAITTEVVDIRPNGVLVVQAIRIRKVNGVEERLRLTGEIAPEAVRGNAVKSDQVVHLSMSTEGGGAAGSMGWILDKLWPF